MSALITSIICQCPRSLGLGPTIIFLVVQKLDQETHKDWEGHSYQEHLEDLPTWESLKKFLESKFRTLELMSPAAPTREKPREKSFAATATTSIEKTCVKCKEQHTLCYCKQFTDMNVKNRQKRVCEEKQTVLQLLVTGARNVQMSSSY